MAHAIELHKWRARRVITTHSCNLTCRSALTWCAQAEFALSAKPPPHAIRGVSWETFVLEDVLLRHKAMAYPHGAAHFWRMAGGAKVNLLLERGVPLHALASDSTTGACLLAKTDARYRK